MKFYIPTTSKHQNESIINRRIAGVNHKLKQKAELYWIHHDGMKDPKSEGYVGVTVRDNAGKRLETHREGFIEAGFMTAEEAKSLKVEVLMTGTYGEMNAQEGVFRPYLGIGWNYLNGGGSVFGMAYLNPRNWTSWAIKAIEKAGL